MNRDTFCQTTSYIPHLIAWLTLRSVFVNSLAWHQCPILFAHAVSIFKLQIKIGYTFNYLCVCVCVSQNYRRVCVEVSG